MAGHANHYLAVFDGVTGAALDLFRTRRTASAAQRIMLAARDGGCTKPGCTVGVYGCQVHHATADWAHGGNTNVDDMALACPPDNRSVGPDGYTTCMNDRHEVEWIPPHDLDTGQARINYYHRPEALLRPPDDDPQPPPDNTTDTADNDTAAAIDTAAAHEPCNQPDLDIPCDDDLDVPAETTAVPEPCDQPDLDIADDRCDEDPCDEDDPQPRTADTADTAAVPESCDQPDLDIPCDDLTSPTSRTTTTPVTSQTTQTTHATTTHPTRTIHPARGMTPPPKPHRRNPSGSTTALLPPYWRAAMPTAQTPRNRTYCGCRSRPTSPHHLNPTRTRTTITSPSTPGYSSAMTTPMAARECADRSDRQRPGAWIQAIARTWWCRCTPADRRRQCLATPDELLRGDPGG